MLTTSTCRWLLWCCYCRYGGLARLLFGELGFLDESATAPTTIRQITEWDDGVRLKAEFIASQQTDVTAMIWPDTVSHQVITTRPGQVSLHILPGIKIAAHLSIIGRQNLPIGPLGILKSVRYQVYKCAVGVDLSLARGNYSSSHTTWQYQNSNSKELV